MPCNVVSKASCSLYVREHNKEKARWKRREEYKHLTSRSSIHGAHHESVFIESKAGAQFGIKLKITPEAYSLLHPHMKKRRDDYSIEVVLDGVVVSQVARPRSEDKSYWCSYVHSGDTEHNFEFSPLSLFDPEAETTGSEAVSQQKHELCEDTEVIDNLGSIQINITRSKFGKSHRRSGSSVSTKPLPQTSNEMSFSEQSKIATLSNTAGLVKGQPIHRDDSKKPSKSWGLVYSTEWDDPHPFLQFVFKYRSRDLLEAQGIISSTPPPPYPIPETGPIAAMSPLPAPPPGPSPIIAAPEQPSADLGISNHISSELGGLSSKLDTLEQPSAEIDQLGEDERDHESAPDYGDSKENKSKTEALERKESVQAEPDIKPKCEVPVQSTSSGPLISIATDQSPPALNALTRVSQSAVEEKKPKKDPVKEEPDIKPKCEVPVQSTSSGPLISVVPDQSPPALNAPIGVSQSAADEKRPKPEALERKDCVDEEPDIKPNCEVPVTSASSGPPTVVPDQAPAVLNVSTKPRQPVADVKKPNSEALEIKKERDIKPNPEVPRPSTDSGPLGIAPIQLDAASPNAPTKLSHHAIVENKRKSTSIQSAVVDAKRHRPLSVELINDDQKPKLGYIKIDADDEMKTKRIQPDGNEQSKPTCIDDQCDDKLTTKAEPTPASLIPSTSASVNSASRAILETTVGSIENSDSILTSQIEKKCLKRVIVIDDDDDENTKMKFKKKLTDVIDLTRD